MCVCKIYDCDNKKQNKNNNKITCLLQVKNMGAFFNFF